MIDNKSKEDFDTMAVIALIFRWKWFVIVFTLIIGIAASIYSFLLPNWYSSTIVCVPPKTSGSMLESALGNISSALKEFGMTKIGGKGGDAYSFLVILNSRTIKDSIIRKYDIQKEYEMEGLRFSAVRDAFESNLEINFENDGNYNITIYSKDPNKAVDMVNDYFNMANSLAQNIYQNESKINRKYLEMRLQSTEEFLAKISDSLQKYSSSKNIISPQDQAKAVSTSLVELKAEQMKQGIVLQLLKNKYGENDAMTKLQQSAVDELNKQVSNIESKPGFAGNFALSNATEVGIKYMKLYTQYETFSKVKSFLLPLLEEAKLNEERETYSLIPVDMPIPADKKAKPKRSVIIAGATLGGFGISILIVVIVYNIRNFRKKLKEYSNKYND